MFTRDSEHIETEKVMGFEKKLEEFVSQELHHQTVVIGINDSHKGWQESKDKCERYRKELIDHGS